MFGFRFIKIPPTTYLLEFRNGRIVREGTGLSFFYYAPTTSLVAVPIGSSDEQFIFEETTVDHQTVTLQGQVTYRVSDAKKLAGLMNFTLAPNGQRYLSEDPEKLPQRVVNLVHVLARGELEKLSLRDTMRAADIIVTNLRGPSPKTPRKAPNLAPEDALLAAVVRNNNGPKASKKGVRDVILPSRENPLFLPPKTS